MAVLPASDRRADMWALLFKGLRVPVVRDEPVPTVLPDGTLESCYFVDFRETGDAHLEHMKRVNEERPSKNRAAVAGMLNARIYQILAENVTVVRARRGLWFQP